MLKYLKIVKGFIIDVLQILCHYCLLLDNLLYVFWVLVLVFLSDIKNTVNDLSDQIQPIIDQADSFKNDVSNSRTDFIC